MSLPSRMHTRHFTVRSPVYIICCLRFTIAIKQEHIKITFFYLIEINVTGFTIWHFQRGIFTTLIQVIFVFIMYFSKDLRRADNQNYNVNNILKLFLNEVLSFG